MKKLFLLLCLVSIVFFATISGASAYTISPITQSTFDAMAGSELSSLPLSSPVTISGPTFTSSLYFKVYYNSGSDIYTYAYQLLNGATSATKLTRMTITNPYQVQMYNMPGGSPDTLSYGYVTNDAGGVGLNQIPTAFVSENASFNGYFGFEFRGSDAAPLLDQGESTTWMYARYKYPPGQTNSSVQDSSSGNGLAVGPVPEPGSVLLLGMGILGLLGIKRRKVI